LKELRNVKVLHIATHGFFMDNEDMSTDLEGLNKNRAIENPLHRCGLLLKDGGYLMNQDNVYQFNSSDGILTAYEAMNLNFDNTDLVVLSACETGLGKVQQGEGVFGLQRSFLVAGSKSVIMSLFKVSDEVTQELMNTFYEKWITTGNKRQAFIDAKKVIKEKYQWPIYWGAFIMVGLE
ncbi:MAG: CHAT domain-containing protein, partial [Flavobacterium sp.]